MTELFKWKVLSDASGESKFVTTRAKYGDGYSQVIPQGLNNEDQRWSVTYAGYKAEVQEVVDFLRARKGTSFLWTPPLGVQGFYQCESYRVINNGALHFSVMMDFQQVYEP